MGRLTRLIEGSTGLKITYTGLAAYGLYTLAKFFSLSTEDSVLMVLVAGLGNLGLLASVISMVVTGVRRARQGRSRMAWSIWACLGCLPFTLPIFTALMSVAVSVEGPKVEHQWPAVQEMLKIKIEEIKAKSPRSPALPTFSKSYAEGQYRYRGEVIDYVDKDFKTVKYEPTEKIRKEREFWVNLPVRIKAVRRERLLEGGIAFSILLISILSGFFSSIDRTSDTPREPSR